MKESKFQSNFIKKLKRTLPDCIVLKNDSKYKQGVPDLLVLFKNKWAMLEIKKSKRSKHQPNQDYWIDKLNKMSFAMFVYPENEKEAIKKLKEVLQ